MIKAIAFILGLCLILAAAQHVFVINDFRIYQSVEGFYAEAKNTLDAVYIGASNVYAFYQPVVAWKEYGITVYSLSTPSMQIPAVKNYLIEARKTQPDALYIINLNNCRKLNEITEARIHYVADYMRFSANKVDMIERLASYSEFKGLEKLEFYFPIIRYHSTWDTLENEHFIREINNLKGSSTFSTFLSKSDDITHLCSASQERGQIPENVMFELNDLLDYCENEQVKVLFALVPQGLEDVEYVKTLNSVADLVAERGFTMLNLLQDFEILGMDKTKDFYNWQHTNIHGSLKYTNYLSKYLIDNYDFEDKRGNVAYSDWDQAAEQYYKKIGVYSYDIEQEDRPRDWRMPAPEKLKAKQKDDTVNVSWSAVDGAAAYYVYRRERDPEVGWEVWSEYAYTDQTKLADSAVKTGFSYKYAVVPVREENGQTIYGDIDYAGVSVKIK